MDFRTKNITASLSVAAAVTMGAVACSFDTSEEEAKNPFDVTFTFEKRDPNEHPLFRELKPGSSSIASDSPLLKDPVNLDETYRGTVTYVNETDRKLVCQTGHREFVSVETGTTGNVIHFDTLAENEVAPLFPDVIVEPNATVRSSYEVEMPQLSDEAKARAGEKLGTVDIFYKCIVQ